MRKHDEIDNSIDADLNHLLTEERYREALGVLNGLRRSLSRTSSVDAHRVVFLLYQQSNCLYELGEYRNGLIKIKAALRIARAHSQDSMYADMKLVYGRILVRLGRFVEAMEEFTESYAFYRKTNDYKSLLVPLSNLAQVHYITGNLHRSCEVLELAIGYAERSGSEEDVEIDKRNLARVLIYMGKFPEAVSLLNSLSLVNSDACGVANALLLKGMCHVYSLRPQKARNIVDQALGIFNMLSTQRDIAVCHEYLGLLEYYRGNYCKAREYYQKVLDMPEPTASAVAQTLRMLTDVYIAEGKWRKAMVTAKKAEEAITKINERIELGALYRAYGQIHTHQNVNETGRGHFRKSVDLLREIGARYELAMSYFTAGQSESYDPDERMSHLHTARTLFTEMDVPKRVEQVDEAIAELKSQPIHSIAPVETSDESPSIITSDPAMLNIIAAADRVKNSDLTILLTGDTGTGKDLLAEHIHRTSNRAAEPFKVVNCAAIPESLLESELFGFRKGIYTGAVTDKVGLLEAADSGTFCFDEIGEMPTAVQAKILRVIETRRVRRLGDTTSREIDVRLIAMTNLDLVKQVESGCFRRDLYHRLQAFPLHLPPLRKRLDDIEPLARHFLRQAGITEESLDWREMRELIGVLQQRKWSGNVRELKFLIRRLATMVEKPTVGAILSEYMRHQHTTERDLILDALNRNGGNRSEAARELGIHEATLRYRLKKYGI